MVTWPFGNEFPSDCRFGEAGGTRTFPVQTSSAPNSSEGSSLAGSRRLALLIGLMGFVLSAASETPPEGSASAASGRSAQLTIGLPSGDDPAVSFAFGDGKLAIDLPRGATFPFDFERESEGLLRSGTVTTLSDSRVRLDLKLASGVVNGIDVGPRSVVIRLTSRFSAEEVGSAEGAQSYRLG